MYIYSYLRRQEQTSCGKQYLPRRFRGNFIFPPVTRILIESGTSSSRGGHEWSGSNRGLWSAVDSAHHINYLELLAVFLVLKTYAKDLGHCTVLVKSDNIFSSDLHQLKGGAHSKQVCSLAIEIWDGV